MKNRRQLASANTTVYVGAQRVKRRPARPRRGVRVSTVRYATRRTRLTDRRRMRNGMKRRMGVGRLALARMEQGKSLQGKGFSSVGPGMQVGNIWADQRVGGPRAAAEGLQSMALGITAQGRLAAAKALHPACDLGPQRWPDKAANESVVLQNTDVFLIGAGSPHEGSSWNAQFWVPTFLDCCLILATSEANVWHDPVDNSDGMNRANTGTLAQQQAGNGHYAMLYSAPWDGGDGPPTGTAKHPDNYYQSARITARSVTIDLVSNATSNQGVVYAGQFTPATTLMPWDKENVALSKEDVRKLVLDELTRLAKVDESDDEDNAPSDGSWTDGGDEDREDPTVDDLVDKFDKVTLNRDVLRDDPLPPEGSQTGQRVVFQKWPINPQEIIQMSPGSYMAKADQGVYMVLKHSADVLQYASAANEAFLSPVYPHYTDNNTTHKNVLLTDGWNMGAISFAGLSPGAMLSVKVITCIEATARPDDILTKYTEDCPPLDKLAQDHTRAAMGKLPDAFPACDNVLGGIVKWIGDALAASGIPIVSQIAGFAGMMNRATGGKATTWLDQNVF